MKKLVYIAAFAFILAALISCKPDKSDKSSISTVSKTVLTTVTFEIIPSGEEEWSTPAEVPSDETE